MATVSLPEAPQRFLLRGVNWSQYRKISEALTGRHLRLTYDRGNLELMTISSAHGSFCRLLGRFVAVLTEELGLPMRSCGDMTCDREDLERGAEPDECFYIAHEPMIRDKEQIDLASDPPPDLVIEVDISRRSLNRLTIYAALGVPEVWRFDGEKVTIHQLGDGADYTISERSPMFPFVSGAEVAKFLHLQNQTEENALVKSFREWVRKQIGPSK